MYLTKKEWFRLQGTETSAYLYEFLKTLHVDFPMIVVAGGFLHT